MATADLLPLPARTDAALSDLALKSCCAALYESDWARLLLGTSFHPGGLALTERLGTLLQLQPGMRVLDIAAGVGSSPLYLAERFGCQVIGIEYSLASTVAANEAAVTAGLAHLVQFVQGDGERLPFPSSFFDALICECAFCTFPDKASAAAEFGRVLRHNGRIGLSDLTRQGELPPELNTLLAWVACIADALPAASYRSFLEQAGASISLEESHPNALQQLIHDVRGKLIGAELLVKLKQISLPGADFDQAKTIARAAARSVTAGELDYSLFIASKGCAYRPKL